VKAPRLFVDLPLAAGVTFDLPAAAARHARVRRVQPGDVLLLFDGRGEDWPAEVLDVGRSRLPVRVGAPQAALPELPWRLTLAVGMPANERMDTLVEKATELGAARLQPLSCERSVLRPAGDRAERRRLHWQAIAVAACEQCGRASVPVVEPVATFADWLARGDIEGQRLMLAPAAPPLRTLAAPAAATLLSGPEGGLAPAEAAAAAAAGFVAAGLGDRVLRADTAPLAALAWFVLQA
jgi:16S rRNA (uracil1498-N3)-methyltransferase